MVTFEAEKAPEEACNNNILKFVPPSGVLSKVY